MKKVIAILLSLVLILSFTACGENSNIMEFEADTYIVEERITGKQATVSDHPFEANLIVDLDNYSLEYTDENDTYYATLEEFDESLDYSGTGYHVRWDKAPKRKGWELFDDFEVISSYLCIYPEEKNKATAILGFYVYNRVYIDYVVIQSWNLK